MLGRSRELMARWPRLTNVAVSAGLSGVADANCQALEAHARRAAPGGGEEPLEERAHSSGIRRWTTMVAWGGLLGVALPPWYRRLDVWFGPGMNPLKLLFHQFMMSPIFNTCFLSYIETMRELPLDTAPQRVQRRLEADLVPLTSRSFPFWIVVNTMNLYCIPQQLRTVTMSCVNCGWTMYLSWLAHQ